MFYPLEFTLSLVHLIYVLDVDLCFETFGSDVDTVTMEADPRNLFPSSSVLDLVGASLFDPDDLSESSSLFRNTL